MLRYVTTGAALLAMSAGYQAEIMKWRQQKEVELKADGGWLTVTGLFWLQEGDNRIAGAPGVFELHQGKALVRADTGAVPEMGPHATIVPGPLTFSGLQRSGRAGARPTATTTRRPADFPGQRAFRCPERARSR